VARGGKYCVRPDKGVLSWVKIVLTGIVGCPEGGGAGWGTEGGTEV